jgi:hypothetical protein
VVEQDLRVALGDREVLVGRRHVAEEADVQRRVERRVDVAERGRERQVTVRLDQAGHDRRAGAVDHLVARLGYGSAAGPHGFHPVAPDHDVGRYRWRAGAVEDLAAGEDDPVHCFSLYPEAR